jgi:hypothetical protein
MTGKRVIGRGGFGFELSEMYGGYIISHIGVVRIGGLDIRLTTLGAVNYFMRLGMNGLDFIQNAITGGQDVRDIMTGQSSLSSSLSTGLRISGGALANLFGGSGGHKEHDINDLSSIMMLLFDILMFVTLTVGYVLEPIFFSEKQLREESDIRDKFYYSLAMVEYGIAFTTASSLAISAWSGFLWECVVHLSGKGTVSVDSKEYVNNNLHLGFFESPMAGLKEKKHMSGKEIAREVFEVLAGGMEAGGDYLGEFLGEKFGKKSANEEFEEELRSL